MFVTPASVYSVGKRYKTEIESAKLVNKQLDITNYNDDIEVLLKSNIVRLGNTIANTNLQKASLSQVTTSFGILFDKLRLLQGKSTSNVASNIALSLNPEQLEIVNSAIKSLKESMLNN